MVTISLAFVAGFGALAFGSFLANVYFGAISALVILLALACDLLLTPCLVLMLPHWFVDAKVASSVVGARHASPALHEGVKPDRIVQDVFPR